MIRVATIEDEAAIYLLAKQLATSFEVSRSGFASSFQTIITADHMHLLVADLEGEVVGYVLASYHPCFYASGNVAWTDEIFVNPSIRGEGVGRSLMDAIESWATDNGCKLSGLATRRAAPFYRAMDYKESATYFKKDLENKSPPLIPEPS